MPGTPGKGRRIQPMLIFHNPVHHQRAGEMPAEARLPTMFAMDGG